MGGLLHDIGKVGIPDAILRKADRLTPDEFAVIRTHPGVGARLLAGHPLGDFVRDMVLLHHERPDGRGYPFEHSGLTTPLAARIVGVCDAFDAMTSHRPFRSGMPVDRALTILGENAGTQFDDVLAARFIELGRGRLLEHVHAHTDDGIPLRSCPTCGPTLVIRREHAAGDSIVCPNCASVFELVQDDAELTTRLTGRHGSALDLAPAPDDLLIGRLVTSAVRALPVSEMERVWRRGPARARCGASSGSRCPGVSCATRFWYRPSWGAY